MTDRKKFKIMYPKDYWDKSKAGKPFIAPPKTMIVMNQGGVFFLIKEPAGCSATMQKLSDVIYKYDVIWKS